MFEAVPYQFTNKKRNRKYSTVTVGVGEAYRRYSLSCGESLKLKNANENKQSKVYYKISD
jgi:hypothetical protein